MSGSLSDLEFVKSLLKKKNVSIPAKPKTISSDSKKEKSEVTDENPTIKSCSNKPDDCNNISTETRDEKSNACFFNRISANESKTSDESSNINNGTLRPVTSGFYKSDSNIEIGQNAVDFKFPTSYQGVVSETFPSSISPVGVKPRAPPENVIVPGNKSKPDDRKAILEALRKRKSLLNVSDQHKVENTESKDEGSQNKMECNEPSILKGEGSLKKQEKNELSILKEEGSQKKPESNELSILKALRKKKLTEKKALEEVMESCSYDSDELCIEEFPLNSLRNLDEVEGMASSRIQFTSNSDKKKVIAINLLEKTSKVEEHESIKLGNEIDQATKESVEHDLELLDAKKSEIRKLLENEESKIKDLLPESTNMIDGTKVASPGMESISEDEFLEDGEISDSEEDNFKESLVTKIVSIYLAVYCYNYKYLLNSRYALKTNSCC